MKTLSDAGEFARLNALCAGKVIERIGYHDGGMDNLVLYFTDGTKVVLSTLGGVEIEDAE